MSSPKIVDPRCGRAVAFLQRLVCEKQQESTVTEWLYDHLYATLLDVQCPLCEQYRLDVQVRRENTNYCDDENNYLFSCSACYLDRAEYWEEQWAEYYNMVR